MVNEISSSRAFAMQANLSAGKAGGVESASQPEGVGVRQELAASGKDMPPSIHATPPLANTPATADEPPLTESAMLEAMKRMQDFIQTVDRDLHFEIDKESGRTIITVIDAKTDEIVRQIPPKEVLSVMHALESGHGLLGGFKV